MPSSDNKIIIACAGSGKTTRLVLDAIEERDRRIAFVTYTINNTRGIIERFGERNGGVPSHVDVMTWFGFLLRECARPYQHVLYGGERIESIMFTSGHSAKYVSTSDTRGYYFARGDLIYTDKISEFIVRCDEASDGLVTRRLRQVYTDLYIDECQDLAGWDWNVVELLLRSGMRIRLVGDPRQSVLSTNLARKNKRYRKCGVTGLLEKWEAERLCKIETMNKTRRCNRAICDFVNALWPGMDDMVPLSNEATGHDGVFLVAEGQVDVYLRQFAPQVLKRQRRKNAPMYERKGMNFGVAKGSEWDRVLIVPSGPIKKFLESGDAGPLKEKDRLHVAITRARHSVAFVHDGKSAIVRNRWP